MGAEGSRSDQLWKQVIHLGDWWKASERTVTVLIYTEGMVSEYKHHYGLQGNGQIQKRRPEFSSEKGLIMESPVALERRVSSENPELDLECSKAV